MFLCVNATKIYFWRERMKMMQLRIMNRLKIIVEKFGKKQARHTCKCMIHDERFGVGYCSLLEIAAPSKTLNSNSSP